jgi:hypothetical protein
MTIVFQPNSELLSQARVSLARHTRIYWLLGGACAGKSTLSGAVAARRDIRVCTMDELIYGTWMERYTKERHPASTAWFSRENPLEWSLSLSWNSFESLNRAAAIECLDLFAEDMAEAPDGVPLLADGGLMHPSILAKAIPPDRIVCIDIDAESGAHRWNHDEERAGMKSAVRALPGGETAWRKFLDFDRRITEMIRAESRACGIRIIRRDAALSIDDAASEVLSHLGL